jgi:hypothetical protein
MKFFSKLRTMIVAVPMTDTSNRHWERASSREIQLELDFGVAKGFRRTRGSALANPLADEKRPNGLEHPDI